MSGSSCRFSFAVVALMAATPDFSLLTPLPSLLARRDAGATILGAQPQLQHGEKARRILDEMIRVIDGIFAKQQAARKAPDTTWTNLWDGRTLGQWRRTEFAGGGEVRIDPTFRNGPPAIVVAAGATLSGFNWTGEAPTAGYEIALDFMKIEGGDFACGLTFPVADAHATLVLGGWGGGTVGISSIDGMDASENETATWIAFPENRWFSVRMRVTPGRLQAWLDDKQIVDQDITGRRISLRHGEISRSTPLGVSTFQTSAAFRNIRLRRL
ncbi:MAG: DUF1080 domain-containing protein [Armatimonadetes bacterium]|nr:DUF1080 domain-containing protein [Armatimonadota bacterium]